MIKTRAWAWSHDVTDRMRLVTAGCARVARMPIPIARSEACHEGWYSHDVRQGQSF